MRSLILARHGFAGSNRDGIASCAVPGEGLVPEGVEQARTLRALLAAEPIALAATTELGRTQETLGLVLEGRAVGVIVVPELNEIHFGSFEDRYVSSGPPSRSTSARSREDRSTRTGRGLRLGRRTNGRPAGARAVPTRPRGSPGGYEQGSPAPRTRSCSSVMR